MIRVSDTTIRTRTGGGMLTVFGLFFFVPGCAALVATVMGKSEGPMVSGILLSLVFIAVGGAIAFGRSGVTIDIPSRTYVRWYGLLVPMKVMRGSIEDFTQVEISAQSSGGKHPTTVFPIRLGGAGKPLDLTDGSDAEKARACAEQVARALRLKLVDRTGLEEVVRDPDHLDESLRQRRRRLGEGPVKVPEPPPGMATQCHVEGLEMVMEIPPAGPSVLGLIVLAPAFGFAAITVVFFLVPILSDMKDAPLPVRLVFVGFLSVFFILLPIAVGMGAFLRASYTRYSVRVSKEMLRVTRKGVLLSKTVEIPADEIEEVNLTTERAAPQISPQTAILARGDRATVAFGGHLPEHEKLWIKAVIEQVLSS